MLIKPVKWENEVLVLIDQRALPGELKYVRINNYKDTAKAITDMVVRGAPAIGIAAAFGIALAAFEYKNDDKEGFVKFIKEASEELKASRPTAVNLFWAANRMLEVLSLKKEKSIQAIREILKEEAQKILNEDIQMCRAIGEAGNALVKDGNSIITHCNAGGLATGGYGTALAVMFYAKEQGKGIKVYADETRPRLQGAKLTVWELEKAGIDVTLVCDNMSGYLMSKGLIDFAVTGADRIASNGDAANKIGTLNLAITCNYFKIPFYIAAPASTFDLNLKTGKEIPIEERDKEEVLFVGKEPVSLKNIKTVNPAFDVTPAALIEGIITNKGVIYPPYEENIKKILGGAT